MMKKIILIVLLGLTSLFSADIVGKWQIDMKKTGESNPLEKMEESKQFVVMMFVGTWAEVVFSADGTFKLIKAKQNGIWKKTGDTYIIQSSAKAPENKLTMLDDSHMKIMFDNPDLGVLIFHFQQSKK